MGGGEFKDASPSSQNMENKLLKRSGDEVCVIKFRLNFHFWQHVKIFSGLSKRAFSLRAIFECPLMQQWYNNYPRQFIQMIDYGQ